MTSPPGAQAQPISTQDRKSSCHIHFSIHGAVRTLTGFCLEFRSGGSRILLNCGLFQGSKSREALNY
jgi:metallo-beta-lactamase family protein